MDGSPGRTLGELRQAVGENGRYALAIGDDFRTIPADAGEAARAAHPDDLQAALTQFLRTRGVTSAEFQMGLRRGACLRALAKDVDVSEKPVTGAQPRDINEPPITIMSIVAAATGGK